MPVSVVDRGSRNTISTPSGFLESQTGTIVFEGSDSVVSVGQGTTLHGGRLVLGEGCSFECGRDCRLASIEVYAVRDGRVSIGDRCGFTSHCRVYLHEPGQIVFGEGCLIAGGTMLSISDMHSIIDAASGERLNPAKNIHLGDRVWLGEEVRVWKGALIGDGAIVGIGSLVTKSIPADTLAVGAPAKVIRTGVTWRQDLIPCVDAEPRTPHHGEYHPATSATATTAEHRAAGESVGCCFSSDPSSFITTLHPDDEVLRNGRSYFGDEAATRIAYFRHGGWMREDLQQIIDWRWGGYGVVSRMLEVAAGHGRLTRHLAQQIAAARLWCTDPDPGAADFLAATFGVNGIVAGASLADFRSDERFDCIVALSTFTRLSPDAFEAALDRLLDHLTPGGLLVFAVNDALWFNHGPMPHEGFAFVPGIDGAGRAADSMFVTEHFVRGCIERVNGLDAPYVRWRRGLCSHHDLYIVGRDLPTDLAPPQFRRGPEGCVDRCEPTADGGLELSGWAGDPDDGHGPVRVRIMAGDRLVAEIEPALPRPDVAAAYREPQYASVGWRCVVEAANRDTPVAVVAIAADGRRRLLDVRGS